MNATQLVGQVVGHTPLWVWALLAFITLLGLRQAKDQVLSSGRVIGVSLGWTVLSLLGAASTVGFSAGVLLAWAGGLGLSLALQHGRVAPRGVFGVRYVSSAMVVLDPALRQHAGFGLAVAAIYGLLSSLFVGRALRVLGSGTPRAATLAAA
jgi:hypothetical protein